MSRAGALLAALLAACAARRTEVSVFEGAPGFTEEARREEVVALDARPGDRIDLAAPFAWVRFQPAADAAAPRVRWSARIRARTRQEAADLLARIRVEVSGGGGAALRVAVVAAPLVVRAGESVWRVHPALDVLVEMPAGCAVHAEVGSGDVIVQGPAGACDVSTDYGRIALRDVAGDVRARSGSGDVEVRGARGPSAVVATEYGRVELTAVRAKAIDARSGSGDVRLTDVEGAVAARSSYGAVHVEGALGMVTATSGSGSVTVRAGAASAPAGTWVVRSDHGDVLLELAPDFACDVAAATRFGAVASDFPGQASEDGRRFQARLGAGGTRIELATGSGSIRILRSRPPS